MAERGLQLLGAKPSPYVTRVMLSLSLKGIPYEFVPENLMNKSELLLRSNPVHKKVPVLIHDGKALSESLVILEYIEDAWPSNGSRLLSSDPYQRAQARFWAAFVDGKLMDSLKKIFMNRDKELQKQGAEEAKESFAELENLLREGGKPFFGGDIPGFVDVVLGCHYATIKATENVGGFVFINADATPLLNAWLLRFSQTKGIEGLLPDPALLTEFYKKKFQSTS
eukprot:TRINITY_DN3504_c0_g1_i2.p1 TRINITY_DN3504_c0_g1~~TRINITY_DN3504_c0_g1_i2.p1  ORF type:complete len:225 (+),score=15.11 TRINITY_DN3504_c0_g1_i2:360-1034(+)